MYSTELYQDSLYSIPPSIEPSLDFSYSFKLQNASGTFFSLLKEFTLYPNALIFDQTFEP